MPGRLRGRKTESTSFANAPSLILLSQNIHDCQFYSARDMSKATALNVGKVYKGKRPQGSGLSLNPGRLIKGAYLPAAADAVWSSNCAARPTSCTPKNNSGVFVLGSTPP